MSFNIRLLLNGYLVAVGATFALTLVMHFLQPVFRGAPPVHLFLVGVMLASWFGGLRAGLLATVLSGLASVYLLSEPFLSFQVLEERERLRIVLFMSVGGLTSLVIEMLSRSKLRVFREMVSHRERLEQEIAMRTQAEAALRRAQELNDKTLQALPASICVIDQQGCILSVNKTWTQFAQDNGATESPAVGVGANYLEVCRHALADKDADAARALAGIEAVLSGIQAQFTMEYPCFSPQRRQWFFMNVVPFSSAGDGGALVTHLDISDIKIAEEALHESEERYRTLFEGSRDGVVAVDMSGYIQYANPAYQEMLGYSLDELKRLTYRDLTPASWHEAEAALVRERILPHGDSQEYDKEYIRKDGSVFPVSLRTHLLRGANGQPQGMWAIVRDITERKRAEEALRESEERLQAFLENSAVIGWFRDEDGRRLFLSENYKRRFGVSTADWRNNAGFKGPPNAAADVFWRNDQAVLAADKPIEVVECITDPQGRKTWWLNHKFAFRDAAGRRYVGGLGVDITERIRAEEELRRLNMELEQRVQERTHELLGHKQQLTASLNEKEVLLKEIHHRVKNNLQIITSLLKMQAETQTDAGVREQFQDCQNRVRSMALIHEQLYKSQDLKTIDFAGYAAQLIGQIHRAFARNVSRVTIRIEIPPLLIDIDQALPLGLIVNELVSNSFKHAFNVPSTAGDNALWVTVEPNALEGLVLEVGDSGKGIPEEIDLDRSPSMGLLLVRSLVTQLQGRLRMERQPHAAFRIVLPREKILRRTNSP